MSWSETNRRLAALREVEAALNDNPRGPLPWNDSYAEVFGDRDGLLAALRYRWNLMVEAQIDPELIESELDERWHDLTTQHAGLLVFLNRFHQPMSQPAAGVRELDYAS